MNTQTDLEEAIARSIAACGGKEAYEREGIHAFARLNARLLDERKELLTALSGLVVFLGTCHICGGTLHLEDAGPTHCEDCSNDCEEHDNEPCSLATIHRAAAALISRLEKSK